MTSEDNPVSRLAEEEREGMGDMNKWVAAALVSFSAGLDQGTKWWTVNNVVLHDSFPVFGQWLWWAHERNTGAAFSMLSNNNGFFIGLSLLALVGLILCLWKKVFSGKLNQTALLLVLSGVIGNGTDRLVHKSVIDFISVDLGFWPFHPWPTFNVADSAICVAVLLLFYTSLRDEWQARSKHKDQEQ